MIEVWSPIQQYEGLYEVSNHGRIRSLPRTAAVQGNSHRAVPGKERKTFLNAKGYFIVVLSKNNQLKTFTVHQLVAQAFMPGFVKGQELNHIDGNKANPRIDNLELSDASHNQLHAVRTGLKSKTGTSQYRNVTYIDNPKAVSKWAGSIRHEGKSSFGWKTFRTEEEAARHVDALLDAIGDTSRPRNFP